MSAAEKLRPVVDLSHTIDHAQLWPDAEACPDWPLYPSEVSARMNGPRGRRDAEVRLQALETRLNRGQPVRVPTDEERASTYAALFVEGTAPNWCWPRLGMGHLRPAQRSQEDICDMVIEAAHLRGFIRKLEAREQQAEALKADRAERELKARVTQYTSIRGEHLAELDKLKEAEARHLQAEADRLAHARCVELRRGLRGSHAEALSAGRKLGIDVPDLPELGQD